MLEKNGSNQSVKTDFGKVEFPTKLYGEFLYPAGEYEAVLITLGAGEGANWWCVLFPPLCFLDFSNSVAVKEGVDEADEKEEKVEEQKVKTQEAKEPVFVEEKKDEQEVEVKFFLVELWDKIFS